MEVRTEHLLLRPFVAADFAWLHPVASDPEVTRYTTWGPNDETATRAFLGLAAPPSLLWAVELDGQGIGSAGITDEGGGRYSFGYTLDRSAWGRGYGTELAIVLVRIAREELAAGRIEATCHPDNAASLRVLQKAGLVPGGTRDGRLLYVVPQVSDPGSAPRSR